MTWAPDQRYEELLAAAADGAEAAAREGGADARIEEVRDPLGEGPRTPLRVAKGLGFRGKGHARVAKGSLRRRHQRHTQQREAMT